MRRKVLSVGAWFIGWLITPAIVASVVTAVWGVVQDLPVAVVIVLALAAGCLAAVVALLVLKLLEQFQSAGGADKTKIGTELVRIIDEGKQVKGDAFKGVSFQARSIWERKMVTFIETVFGTTERQRFESNRGAVPNTSLESLEIRLGNLEELRDGEAGWSPRVQGSDLDAAIVDRRTYGYGDVILAVDSPAEQFAGMDESAERFAPTQAPFVATASNPALFHPQENVDLLIAELQVTNRQRERALNYEVEFEVPFEGQKAPFVLKTLPPSFTQTMGLTFPPLVDTPVTVEPERSHVAHFAVFLHGREIDMMNAAAIVRDLISGHEERVRFYQ